MGVRISVKKLLIEPIVFTDAVIVIEIAANASPTRKAAGKANKANGELTRPKIVAANSKAEPVSTDLLALQIASPITMSSGPRGVNSMASYT